MASRGLVNFLVSFLVLFVLGTASSMNYSIVGPKMLRPGSAYQFVVTTYGERNLSFVLHAAIQRNSESFIVEKSFQLTTDTTEVLALEIPNVVPDGRYSFFVKASEGANFSHSHDVTINRKVHSIFIQTDKVLYKPGQEVLFRVVAITPDLKPYKEKINITIYDTAQNKIKKLVDQQSDHGVITNSLKLSDITPLGDWKIHAETLLANTEKNFQVAEYVLPKYEVKVELPSYFFYNENNPPMQQDLPVSVVAKYTYGQPVKGTASVDIKLQQHYWWSTESFPKITKLIQLVDGKGDFSLNVAELKSLLPASWTWATLAYKTFSFEANVTETETGTTLSASNTVETITKRFDLEFLSNSPENYKPGLPYQGYLMLKNSDGSPTLLKDIRNSDGTFKSVHIKSTNSYPYYYYVNDTRPPKTEISFSIPLTENGHIVFSLQTLLETDLINLEASYFDEISNSTITAYKSVNKFKTRDNGGIQLSLKNDENVVKPSSVLQFQVKSVEEIKEFQFQVLAKGLILANRRIDAGLAKKEHTFSVQVTPDLAIKLAPEARFVVSYVTSTGELIADSMAVTVADYFANKVSLSFNKNQTEPGDESVYLNVKTKQNSFVSLLAVDQSVLLLRAGNDITQDMVKDELSSYLEVSYHGGRHPIPFARRKRSIGCWWPIWLGGSDTSSVIDKAGLFVMTNLHVYKPEPRYWYPRYYMPGLAGPPMAFQSSMVVQVDSLDSAMSRVELSEASSPTPSPSVSVRKKFPETWIWSEVISNSNGDYQLKVKVPDTITSWVATGFSVNQDAGLGLSESPAKITVIKPFFVSLNLPYSIIRGEEFALQVTVFNYYGQELEADVKLLASNHFKVINCETKESQSVDVTKKVKVENNDGKSVYFWVVATALGQIPIEVSAHAGLAADAMKATLLVKPEGQTQSYSTSQFIQLSSNETFDTEFQVTLPARDVLVPGSAVIEVTVIGDIIGTALNNIDDLLQMPYGCGEQNLLNLVPDVYLLKYLTESAQLTEEFSQKAKGFINAGYQRELTYQRYDGSFSAFGNQDKSGSVWLSSFVIKCFHQAKEYIPVEDSKIAATMDWIIELQADNGTFAEPPEGRVIHTDMQGGSSAGVAMTAYVLIALLENKNVTLGDTRKLSDAITNATTFLENNMELYSKDPYALAIISYAFFKSGSDKLAETLSLLESLAVNEGGLTYWHKASESSSDNIWRGPYSQAKSYSIEIASYALMVYAQKKDLDKALPIGKWLLKQRNAFGGFSSTQDTVLALEALASFAPLIVPASDGAGVVVSVTAGGGNSFTHQFNAINKHNALFLQSVQLPESTTSVKVHAVGEGVALAQLIVKYNVDNENSNQFLSLNLSTNSVDKKLKLSLSTAWSGSEVTGMVVVEINILTGYSLLDDGNFIQQIGSTFKKVEKSSNKVVIYLDELTYEYVNFDVHLDEVLNIANVKPALVKVYRYYQPDSPVTGFYSSGSDQTWEGACPQCCP